MSLHADLINRALALTEAARDGTPVSAGFSQAMAAGLEADADRAEAMWRRLQRVETELAALRGLAANVVPLDTAKRR